MTTVIFHSADYDGIFCREIAKKFLGEKDVQYIGWNFGDPPICVELSSDRTFWTVQSGKAIGRTDVFYVLDLPIDRVFGIVFDPNAEHGELLRRITWIDHHKSAIESHPKDTPGYRIDGVAACRLAWQWFDAGGNIGRKPYDWILPKKEDFIDRKVSEPLAVRLAGEYDIWDKRDSRAETFQYALRTMDDERGLQSVLTADNLDSLLSQGSVAQRYAQGVDASICKDLTWIMAWEGLKFLCVNHARFNSLLFAARDVPATGHDALLGFRFGGKNWMVSLYHAAHRKDLDLSTIAVKYGGGGHRGACGFTCKTLPFSL